MNQISRCAVVLTLMLAAAPACFGQSDPRVPAPPVPDAPLPNPPDPETQVGTQYVDDPVGRALPLPARHFVIPPSSYWLNPLCTSSTCTADAGASGSYRMPLTRYWHTRVKPCLQRSHWGYCNYFDERPLGAALRGTMRRQVGRASSTKLMLYHYDFYPPGSPRAAALTLRGQEQLVKMLYRMPATPGPILIQAADDDAQLNESRRLHVVSTLAAMGIDEADRFVMFGRPRFGTPGSEAVEQAASMWEAVRARGRTLRAAESPSFGEGSSSGFGNFGN